MRVRQEDTGEEIPLDGEPLGRGGEAEIYAVPNRPQFFAKVYHKPSGERAEKLAAMLAAPPEDPMAPSGHPSIAWPTARLLAPGVNLVVGYLMPRVEHGRLALEFYNPRMRQQLCPLFHYRYLIRTAHNLAAALRAVHERGYVVGDLNESNVLVTNQALVALVDTDSFQVHTPNRLFRCQVGKPEYTPPELQNARFTEIDRLPEHDAFGLAVLIFQFLMQGTHPFAGMQVGEGEAGPIPRRIAAGHWPYAQGWEVPVRPSPHAPPWEVLPPSVQTLMRRCFEDGHANPRARPQAAEWQRALLEAEEELKICAANGQHHYHRGLPACPWCAMAQQQGRDPFPSLQEVRAKGKTTLKVGANGASVDATLPLAAPAETSPAASVANAAPPWRQRLHETRERLGQLRTQMQTWPRSRLIATGAFGGVVVLLFMAILFMLAPRVWSYFARTKPPEIVTPPDVPPPTPRPEEAIAELRICVGHTAKVNAVGFLPDGMRALSCGNDNTLRLWNLADGQEIRRLTGHVSWIMGLAVSADGRQALSASADKSLRAWDLANGGEVRKLEDHATWINAVAISANGRRGLSGGEDRRVQLWDVENARLEFTFTGHSADVRCVALTPDGKMGVSGAANGDVLLWDLERRKRIEKLEGHSQPITGLAFTADGRRVVSAARDRSVQLWDVERGEAIRRVDVPGPDVTGLAVSADGRRWLTVASDGMLRLWDAITGEEVAHAKAPTGPLRCVAISPDGRNALTGGDDGLVRCWRLPSLMPELPSPPSSVPTFDAVSRLDFPGTPRERFFFLPDNRILMMESDRRLTIRNLWGGQEMLSGRDVEISVPMAAVSANGRCLLTRGPRNSPRIRDLHTGAEVQQRGELGSDTTALATNADGRRFFRAERNYTIVRWAADGSESKPLKGHAGPVLALAATPDGDRLLSASADGTVCLWSVADARVLRRFVGFFPNARSISIARAGRFAAILSSPPMPYLLLWDLENDRAVRHLPCSSDRPVKAVYLADSGRHALTLELDDLARIWDVERGEEIGRLAGNYDVAAATFSNGMLLTVDSRATVRRFVLPEGRR